MKAQIRKVDAINGTINAPPSKSYTHRAFIIASLAEGTSIIKNPLLSGDTLSTIKAMRAFGVKIKSDKNVTISGSGGKLATPYKAIDCENSGTTIRLISSIAALDGKVILTGDDSIQKRPMQPLLDAIKQLGVDAYSTKEDGTPPVVIKGGHFNGGTTDIRGDVSSQFISSLLISVPYAKNDVKINITTPMKSKPYVNITLDIMKDFGVKVENENYRRFKIKVGQKYKAKDYVIEGDYSSSSYFLALAALTKSKVTVKNLLKKSKQGDKIILEILKEMGAKINVGKDKVAVSGNGLSGIDVDLGDSPDLLPTVTALACKAKGTTKIKNVEHARFKESDRLAACATEFRKFGVDIIEKKDGLIIHGREKLKGARTYAYNDHRMAMALTVAALSAEGASTIDGIECVNISFPEFYKILNKLCPNKIKISHKKVAN